jgi:hypothetical protein
VTGDPAIDAEIALIAVPTQAIGAMFSPRIRPGARSWCPAPRGSTWTGLGPADLIARAAPGARSRS